MNVPNRILEIIESKNMCQSRVARSAGFDPKLFNAMLHGRKIIRPEYIEPICRSLGVTPNDLFTDDRRE